MRKSFGANEFGYAAASIAGNNRLKFKLVLWGLLFLFSLFTILVQPAWYYERRDSATTYRAGVFGASFGFAQLTEQMPLGLLPAAEKYEFAGFLYVSGIMQTQSVRETGSVITDQRQITCLTIPMWLPLVVSFIILVFTLKRPQRLNKLLKRSS